MIIVTLISMLKTSLSIDLLTSVTQIFMKYNEASDDDNGCSDDFNRKFAFEKFNKIVIPFTLILKTNLPIGSLISTLQIVMTFDKIDASSSASDK